MKNEILGKFFIVIDENDEILLKGELIEAGIDDYFSCRFDDPERTRCSELREIHKSEMIGWQFFDSQTEMAVRYSLKVQKPAEPELKNN